MREVKTGSRSAIDEEEEETEAAAQDVFELLKADHRRVEDLFSRFDEADKRARAAIAEETLREVALHARLEEELVYPAIRYAIEEKDRIDEATEEHHVANLLMKELSKMKPNDEKFPAKFKVLGEIIRHHVEEEENELFPQAEEADMDTAELSREVAARKAKLMRKPERGGKTAEQSRRRKAA
jgi:hemerythrin superfamily protein